MVCTNILLASASSYETTNRRTMRRYYESRHADIDLPNRFVTHPLDDIYETTRKEAKASASHGRLGRCRKNQAKGCLEKLPRFGTLLNVETHGWTPREKRKIYKFFEPIYTLVSFSFRQKMNVYTFYR